MSTWRCERENLNQGREVGNAPKSADIYLSHGRHAKAAGIGFRKRELLEANSGGHGNAAGTSNARKI